MLVLAGCGGTSSTNSKSGSTSGSAATTGSAAATGSSNVQAKAAAEVAKYETLPAASAYPDFKPFKPGTGKAAAMACSFTNDCALAAKGAVEAFHAMGWQSGPAQDGQFSTATWSAFMQRAAAQHLDGVVLVGIDVNVISAAVHQAVNAGVKVTCIFCHSGAQWKGKVYDIGPNLPQAGHIAALRAVATFGNKLKLVDFNDPATDAVFTRHAAVAATMKQACPSCSYNTITIPGADVTKPGPPEWDAYLESHPQGQVNYVIGEFDELGNAITKTDQSSSRTEIKIGGYGLAGAIPYIQNGQQDSIVVYPYGYMGWVAADTLARLKAGAPLPSGTDALPQMLLTHNNIGIVANNTNGGHYIAPPGDWQGAFKKVWGQS